MNNAVVSPGQAISFQNLSQLSIICTAVNSRPSVTMQIYDPTTTNNIPLTRVPPTIAQPNPLAFCDNTLNCQAVLSTTLTPGFAATYKIKQVTCLAYNNTSPYNLNTSISFPLNFSGKQSQQFIFLFSMNLTTKSFKILS